MNYFAMHTTYKLGVTRVCCLSLASHLQVPQSPRLIALPAYGEHLIKLLMVPIPAYGLHPPLLEMGSNLP